MGSSMPFPAGRLLSASLLAVAGMHGDLFAQASNSSPPVLSLHPPVRLPQPAPRTQAFTLDDLVRIAVERNPRLTRAAFAVDAAHGRYVQAGVYPNPVFAFAADELGDRTGPPGILSPQVSQEIVRGGKLRLSQAVAAKEVDQAALAVLAERYALIGAVRVAFYDAYALQERAAILADLVRISEESVNRLRPGVEKGAVAKLDLLQLEIERERTRAEAMAVERELPTAFHRLASVVGVKELPPVLLAGSFDQPVPEYDAVRTRELVLGVHPQVRSAKVGIERAQFALQRAKAEPVPNVTISSGYTRQSQNRSNDWLVGVSVPLPVWNKNQGNIRAAHADLHVAHQEVGRVENELAERVATTFRSYAAAKQRAVWYRDNILGRAKEALDIISQARAAGQVNVLQVLQAQKAVADARLEYNRSLGEAWKAAGELSGLTLEEVFPAPVVPQAKTDGDNPKVEPALRAGPDK
jgi:cobalt-zinc-cadmium efflux system outer membrane protein